jgi:hypothetical protein
MTESKSVALPLGYSPKIMAVPTRIELAISCVTGRHVNRYTTGPYYKIVIYYNKSGDPYGIRTRVTAVKGRCLNRLTNGPDYYWRRRRDLNPRAAYTTYTLSRGAPSATWVLLRGSTSRIRTYDPSVNSRMLYR